MRRHSLMYIYLVMSCGLLFCPVISQYQKSHSLYFTTVIMKSLVLLTLLSTALASALPQKINTTTAGKNFSQWGFLILENTDYATAEANPTFQKIQNLKNNRLLTSYSGVAHPSLPNYIASIAGSSLGVHDDGPVSAHSFPDATVLDLLDTKGISWKMYAEDYPGGCNTEATNGQASSYVSKHNPALYSSSITGDKTRCAKVVPGSEFMTDFTAGTLPQWWYYVPNLTNDGHDTDTPTVAAYLEQTWVPLFQNPTFTKGLAMVMTYDESETKSPNHVFAALIGDAVKPGKKTDSTTYNHYSLIKTVEDNWSLGSLNTGDAKASVISM